MDAVLNWLWQGGVVAAALSVMLFALTRARANVRYMMCWAAALLVIALPLLASLQSPSTVDAIGAADSEAIVALPDAWWTSARVLFAATALWAGVNMFRLVSAVLAIRRARRRCRPFPAHLESILPHWRGVRHDGRRARLVLSNSVTSAAVLGWGTPLIAVAPSLLRTLDPDDLDRVLIHEWAHVQRRDDLVNVVQIVVRLVAGWHPALWWIERRLHVEREIACDEATVAITGLPKSYAQCLMKLSGLKSTPRSMETAPAIFTRSGLRARVVTIMTPRRPIAPLWSRTLACAMVLALCLLSVAVGGVTLVDATAFAEPVLSAATLTGAVGSDRPVTTVASSPSANVTERSLRRATNRSSVPRLSQQPKPEQPPLPSPKQETVPAAPPAPPEPNSIIPTHTPESGPPSAAAVALEAAAVPVPSPVPPNVTTESSRSPWSAAAAGGVTIGRKSKDAGVATAGFFTRVAKRVAGSF